MGGHEADPESHEESDAELPHEEERDIRRAVVRLLDEVDHREDEQHGDRVVEAGLAFEGTSEPLREPDSAKESEDGGAVGRGQDRAEQEALGEREVEQPGCGEACDRRRDDRPDQGEPGGRAENRSDLPEAGSQPALEQDEHERDHPDQASQRVVVEIDPAESVGTDRHPEAQEQDERRKPEARGQQGGPYTGGEQPAGDQQQNGIMAHRAARRLEARHACETCRVGVGDCRGGRPCEPDVLLDRLRR